MGKNFYKQIFLIKIIELILGYMKKVYLSGNIPEDMKKKLEAKAKQLDRPLNYVVNKVLEKGMKGGLDFVR